MQTALRSLLWLTLSAWVGSWLCFALLIAPTAFRVLPSTEVAGSLVGPVLGTLHLFGAGAGLLLAALALALRRGATLVWLPLLLAVACLVTEFAVTPALNAVRDHAFGPDGDLASTARYRQLHGLSMSIFSAVLLGAIGLVLLHVRRDGHTRAGPTRGEALQPPDSA